MSIDWKFRYEKWAEPVNNIAGTIRTVPENYYVATILTNGNVDLSDRMEAMTRNIKAQDIRNWWLRHEREYLGIAPGRGEEYRFDREGKVTGIRKVIKKPTNRKRSTTTTMGRMR